MSLHRARLLAALLLLSALLAACADAPPAPTAAPAQPTAAAEPAQPTAAPAQPTAAAEPAQPSAAPAAAEISDQPYRVGIFSDITTTNFWSYFGPNGTTWNAYILTPQRIALYTLSDKRFEIIPQLALEMPTRPLPREGEFWVAEIKLRENVRWSDGTPVTARDFAFTANTVVQMELPGNWGSTYDWNFLDRVEAVDDYTARLYYAQEPGLAVHEWGALQGPIMQEAYWAPIIEEARGAVGALEPPPAEGASEEELAAYDAALTEAMNVLYNHEPVDEPTAAGWAQGSREPGAFVENVANPDYFQLGANVSVYANGAYIEQGQGYTIELGEPVSETIASYTIGPRSDSAVYTVYGSQDAAILALKNGEIDFILNPLGLQAGLRSQVEGQEGISVLQNPINGYRYMTFNARRQPMDSVAFRQAVATLIDKEFVTRNVLQGVAFPADTFVAPGNTAWFNDDIPRWGLNEDGSAMTPGQRVAAAVEILSAAGFSWEAGSPPVYNEETQQAENISRLIMPDGQPMPEIKLLAPVPSYDPLRSTFAIWIERWMQDVGIPVTTDLKAFNVLRNQLVLEQDFDIALGGWSVGIFPNDLQAFFHSSRAGKGDFNSGGYSNPEFDALSDEILTCTSYEACKAVADNLQRILSTELPYVVLFETGIIEAYRSDALAFPYTDTLSGLQYLNGMPTTVSVLN